MIATLTERQNEVLDHLIAGHSTKQISTALSISPATTRNHIQAIMDRLGVHSRVEAVAYASMHHDAPATRIIDWCRSQRMALLLWQEDALRSAFNPPAVPMSVSGIQVMPLPLQPSSPAAEVLSSQDRAIVTQSLSKVQPEDVDTVRQIHESKLEQLRPQHEAITRAVAMREAALDQLERTT